MDKSRLHYQALYVKSFICTTEQCEESGKGTWLAALNRTDLYPEGRRQPFDTGTLDEVVVLSAHGRGDMTVHKLATPLEPGTLAEGIIGWQKWYDNMQQHTEEHILSGLVRRRFGYDNIGFHIGSEKVTMDFNGSIIPGQLDQLENEVNQVVYDNILIKVLYPSKEELDSLDYRNKKELIGLARIVEIPDANMCAHYGTHIGNTREVGIIKIRSIIHYKDGVHILLLCGRKALLDCRDRPKDGTRLFNLLPAKLDLVPEAVEKLKNDLQDREMLMSRLYGQIFSLRTEQHPEREAPLALFEEGLNMVQIRQLSTLLYRRKGRSIIMVCSPGNGNEEYQYTPRSGYCNMRALSEAMNRRLSGRGGGGAFASQGTSRVDRQSVTKVSPEESALLMETDTQ